MSTTNAIQSNPFNNITIDIDHVLIETQNSILVYFEPDSSNHKSIKVFFNKKVCVLKSYWNKIVIGIKNDWDYSVFLIDNKDSNKPDNVIKGIDLYQLIIDKYKNNLINF